MENVKLVRVRLLAMLIMLMPLAAAGQGDTAHGNDALVKKALENEVRAAGDAQHPMRYRLRKSSPRFTSTKEIVETKDGAVARLISVNDAPLSAEDAEKEQARLASLLSDPSKQRHRKEMEDDDSARALKVLRALPEAFIYRYAGTLEAPAGAIEKFTFTPNPKFDPPDLEAHVLTQMTGEIWIDAAQQRVTKLEGQLQQDVDFGWGILGRLSKGGWIIIDQADVGGGVWRVVKFQMKMTGRLFIRTRTFDTTEVTAQFEPVPGDLGYQQAIAMLRAGQATVAGAR